MMTFFFQISLWTNLQSCFHIEYANEVVIVLVISLNQFCPLKALVLSPTPYCVYSASRQSFHTSLHNANHVG